MSSQSGRQWVSQSGRKRTDFKYTFRGVFERVAFSNSVIPDHHRVATSVTCQLFDTAQTSVRTLSIESGPGSGQFFERLLNKCQKKRADRKPSTTDCVEYFAAEHSNSRTKPRSRSKELRCQSKEMGDRSHNSRVSPFRWSPNLQCRISVAFYQQRISRSFLWRQE